MRRTAWPRLSGVLTLLVTMARPVCAQDNSSLNTLIDQNPSQQGVKACLEGTDFQKEEYRIIHAAVEDPFKFLYWKRIKARFAAMLDNQLFTYKLKADALSLIE